MGSYKGSFKGPFKGIYRDSIGFRAYLEVQTLNLKLKAQNVASRARILNTFCGCISGLVRMSRRALALTCYRGVSSVSWFICVSHWFEWVGLGGGWRFVYHGLGFVFFSAEGGLMFQGFRT